MTTTDLCECGHPRRKHIGPASFCATCSCTTFRQKREDPPAPDLTDLRDRFAMAALTGMLVADGENDWPNHDIAAKRAYQFADAMLRARSDGK